MNLKLTTAQMKETIIPKVARSIIGVVHALYIEGSRNIPLRDMEPEGCGPFCLTYFSITCNDLDKNGCSISYNDAVLHFNRILLY